MMELTHTLAQNIVRNHHVPILGAYNGRTWPTTESSVLVGQSPHRLVLGQLVINTVRSTFRCGDGQVGEWEEIAAIQV